MGTETLLKRSWAWASAVCLLAGGATAESQVVGSRARTGWRGVYRVLPAEQGKPVPIDEVFITRVGGEEGAVVVDVRRKASGGEVKTAIELRLVGAPDGGEGWSRFQIWVPGTGEAYDYRDVHTDRALLPAWLDFERQFFPRPSAGAREEEGFPVTGLMLGHILSLQRVEQGNANVRDYHVLRLDPELLIGTSRTFHDAEGGRLPPDQLENNYQFVPWTKADYEMLIEAGFNTFALVPGIEEWLRGQPVFYRRGVVGEVPLDWPVDFYRSNFRGAAMYADEPACVMLRDEEIRTGVRHFSDAVEIVKSRAASAYEKVSTGLARQLGAFSLGSLEVRQSDVAVWETRYETAFYQLEAGFAGFVHEGRYHLDRFYESPHSFDDYVRASTGLERKHSAEELLKIHYAFLRGAARRFDKDWGTSIYGQADPAMAPLALRLAYNMGARYLWFWTSDKGHHVPWPEQVALSRDLRDHARAHPRGSIRAGRPTVDRLILIPYGELAVLESPMQRRHHWDLWWVRDLDGAGENDVSRRYRAMMRRVFEQVHQALERGESFDIAVDDGHEPPGYGVVFRVGREGE